MIPYNKIIKLALPFVVILASCSKLDEKLNSTLTNEQAASALGDAGTGLLLNAAYADLAVPFHNQDQVFSLEENTTDESLVPTRGGDWDDNGVWRVLHAHTWDANHGQILSVFNNLNKLNFDATNVLAFKPTPAQEAEAKFLRAVSLYYLLDLYGQYPFRNPGDNLLLAPVVKSGAEAVDFIISELNAALPNLNASNSKFQANQDAARVLLMKCYLQKGAFINRAAPTFAAADMQQVITLGNTIINSNKYSYNTNYFDNFNVNNGNSSEGIFAYQNTSGVNVNHGSIESRWNMTLHYNSYTPNNPNAGWNGFSTISDFYSSFGVSAPTNFTPADTLLDKRIGGRYYQGATNVSGLRPGFLVGQQFNEAGVAIKDRKGAPLAYTPQIANNMIELGTNLEVTGIRVVKYVPDYANYGGPAGNDLMLFRYPDVVLMVAEAKMRTNDAAGALLLVNALRQARGAAPVAAMPLVNLNNVEDPATLLAERGRELYWESHRRTDLIRFGVYLKPWQYKTSTNAKNLVFPIPSQALAANPNLKQNLGY
ncbi:MAG: RagB/SusD family nutrient uptake outer membrane protein [Flavisolibacter sp.]|nr:RagB/SusD family nutrient uptake outer membrane protein [Flavisolibacter sp.]